MSDHQSLERQLATLHLSRLLKPYLRAQRFIAVIALPSNIDIGEWHRAASDVISESVIEEWQESMRGKETRVELVHTDSDCKAGLDGVSIARCRTVVLVSEHQVSDFLAHPSIAAADAVIQINELSGGFMQRAFLSACDRKITLAEATAMVTMSEKRRKLVSRAGRNVSAVIASLSQAEKADVSDLIKPKPITDTGSRLEDMYGYGEARVWGLELATDIADYKNGIISWSDVDSGLLLSGPSGCGKTTFAAALARTCDMAFVVGSYASWQSNGHQGDMLKAMRKAFSEAREKAPCVLLIDEVDGFVTRGRSDGSDGGDYMRGVVNGLLEELDSSAGRAGVVVIGACNDASIVDPAVCRPGRLDRHIAIELPDDESRMAILKGHLKSDLDMNTFRTTTEGMTGADLERVARDARRLARRERVSVEYRHVHLALPVRFMRDDDQMYRVAVHEIGHAVVGAVLTFAPLEHVFIVPDYLPRTGNQIAGTAAFQIEDSVHQDQAYYADHICTTVGAMACEKMLLGSHSDGVISDLESATKMATFALSAVGMGDTLTSSGQRDPDALARLRMYDPRLGVRVEELLQEQLARARDILEERRDVVEFLIAELVQRKRLPGSVVYAALEVPQPAQNFG